MTGLLVWREYGARTATGTKDGPSAPSDTWMGIYTKSADGERQIGFIHSESRPGVRGDDIRGTNLGLTVKLAMTMLSIPTEVTIAGTAWNPDDGGLSEFDFSIGSFEHTMRVKGSVSGEKLSIVVETAGESFPAEFPVGKDLFLSGSMGTTTLNLPYLEVGDEILVDTFDPLTLSKGIARIECIGTEQLTVGGDKVSTRVLTSTLSGITTKVWVTGAEEVVRIETPFGFVLRKVDRGEALAGLDQGAGSQLFEMMAVRPSGKEPFRGAKRMEVRVSGLPPAVKIPYDEIQARMGENHIDIRRPSGPNLDGAPLSDPGEYLRGDPFIQVEHPDIAKQAAEIAGDTGDAWGKAVKIYEWVFANVDKTIVLSLPSAVEVLRTRQGDCNEHTVLFAALARAARVPTRIAIGVVWSEELDGFYYHAWPEVYAGRWIPMDPTLEQAIADATHIKLLEGSIEAWPKLVPFLGQMQVEVVNVE